MKRVARRQLYVLRFERAGLKWYGVLVDSPDGLAVAYVDMTSFCLSKGVRFNPWYPGIRMLLKPVKGKTLDAVQMMFRMDIEQQVNRALAKGVASVHTNKPPKGWT